jgi:dihydrofolate reductase
MAGSVRVFIACSLDGFIAGPDDDLSWLPAPEGSGEDYGYTSFITETAAILMGRATYEVAARFDTWPYGALPVFVATSRPLDPVAETVIRVSGTPSDLLAAVRAHTDGAVYLDGGALIRSFLDDGLVDELTVTVVGVILGCGSPLFAGVTRRQPLELTGVTSYPSGLVQLRYVPTRGERLSAGPAVS